MAATYADNSSGYGLISGMANGFREGLIGYQTVQNAKHQQQMQELLSGVTKDDDGNLQFTPEMQAQRQAQQGLLAKKSAAESAEYEAGSPAAVAQQKFLAAQAKNAGLAPEDIPEGLSTHDYDKYHKDIDTGLSAQAMIHRGDYAADQRVQSSQEAADAKVKAAGLLSQSRANAGPKPMTEYQKAMLGYRENNQVSQAAKQFNNDGLMMQLNKTSNSLDRAENLMNGKEPITSSNFNLIQQDLIGATAPGGAATEGKMNRELIDSGIEYLNHIQQKYGDIQDLRKQEPEQFEHLRGLMNQIHGEVKKASANRVKELSEGFQSNQAPAMQGLLQTKQQRYAAPPQAPATPVQNAAPPGGALVIHQNGHDYTWNPQTGKYE